MGLQVSLALVSFVSFLVKMEKNDRNKRRLYELMDVVPLLLVEASSQYLLGPNHFIVCLQLPHCGTVSQ